MGFGCALKVTQGKEGPKASSFLPLHDIGGSQPFFFCGGLYFLGWKQKKAALRQMLLRDVQPYNAGDDAYVVARKKMDTVSARVAEAAGRNWPCSFPRNNPAAAAAAIP